MFTGPSSSPWGTKPFAKVETASFNDSDSFFHGDNAFSDEASNIRSYPISTISSDKGRKDVVEELNVPTEHQEAATSLLYLYHDRVKDIADKEV
jgi:hypothetical protein